MSPRGTSSVDAIFGRLTSFERIVGFAGGITVLTLIVLGYGDLIIFAFTPFILVITGSMWWRSRRGS